MNIEIRQLDRKFNDLRGLSGTTRPPRGWVRAVREALGMTTAQMARRMGVRQPRIVELERAEASGNVTLQSLERAAAALGCRLVYALIPDKPLAETLRERAALAARRQLDAIDQTMRLEAQSVGDKAENEEAHRRLVEKLLRQPARIWDDP